MSIFQPNDNLKSILDDGFVLPTTNQTALEGTLAKRFLYGTNNSREYYKDVISLVLSQLGVKGGVSFDTFVPQVDDHSYGKFLLNANKILLSEQFANADPMTYVTQVLAHETFHKYQSEEDKASKMFGPNRGKHFVGDNNVLAKLLGFTTTSGLYNINNGENEAFIYNSLFINSFLTKAGELAKFLNDPEKQEYVRSQQDYISRVNNAIKLKRESEENTFISKVLPAFYEKSMNTFDSLVHYFLDSQTNSPEELRQDYPELYDKLSSFTFSGVGYPSLAAFSMTALLGACPKKEKVEEFIDTITTSRFDVGDGVIHGIVNNGTPITKTDFTRLAISSRNGDTELPQLFYPKSLDNVNENVWAKNLVVTMGVSQARVIIEDFKNSGEMPNTDFHAVEKVLSSYSTKPLINIDGKNFYNCRELLQFVSARESANYSQFANNAVYYQTCGMLSKNLASLVNHFETPSADNVEFVSALKEFVQNPSAIKYEDTEPRSEVGIIFTPRVSHKVAEFINQARVQQTEDQPSKTVFSPVNKNGVPYEDILNESLGQLTQAIKELTKDIENLTNNINKGELPEILEKLGINQKSIQIDTSDKQVACVSGSGFKMKDDDKDASPDLVVTIKDSGRQAHTSNSSEEALTDRPTEFDEEQESNYIGIISGLLMANQGEYLSGSIVNQVVQERAEMLSLFGDPYQYDEEQDLLLQEQGDKTQEKLGLENEGINQGATFANDGVLMPNDVSLEQTIQQDDKVIQDAQGINDGSNLIDFPCSPEMEQ